MSRDRPRLLLVTAHSSRAGGGVSVAVRDLARIMAPEFDVRVLALADGPTRAEDEPEWKGIDVVTFGIIGFKRYGFSPGLLLALMQTRCAVVHVHGLWKFHCLAVLLLRLTRRIPYLVTPHGMLEPWIVARSPRQKRIIARVYQDRFLRTAAAIHVLTPQEGQDVAAAIGPARSVVIPNFVEPVKREQPRPEWWEAAFDGRDIYLFLGRIHSKKGCLELCEAWERLNATDGAFRDRSALIFCGVVDDIPTFDSRVRELSNRFGNVRSVGPQYGEAKHRSFSAATFFCLPSKSEGLPLAVIEAWSFGVPVIMTPQCNLPIGFEEGAAIRTGVDATSIAVSIAAVSELPAACREKMAQAAINLVRGHFSTSFAKQAYCKLYLTFNDNF